MPSITTHMPCPNEVLLWSSCLPSTHDSLWCSPWVHDRLRPNLDGIHLAERMETPSPSDLQSPGTLCPCRKLSHFERRKSCGKLSHTRDNQLSLTSLCISWAQATQHTQSTYKSNQQSTDDSDVPTSDTHTLVKNPKISTDRCLSKVRAAATEVEHIGSFVHREGANVADSVYFR